MVGRISFNQLHSDIQRSIADKNKINNKLSNQLASQEKVQELRDDPISAAHGSRYDSLIARKKVYVQQNREIADNIQLAEGYVRQSIEMLHRGRELAVQAANGTYDAKDRSYMAEEIDQLIEELVVITNSQDGDGRYLFGGSRSNIPPFRALRTVSDRLHKNVITEVEYIGSNRANKIEVSDQDVVDRSIPGNELFWSKTTTIDGNREVLNYAVQEDSEIVLNNTPIQLSRGDSIYSIITKINESGANINASINTFTGRLQLITTEPTQVWISDQEGTVMQDLGIINGTGDAPYNISGDTIHSEETVFDTLVSLRNAMYTDDYAQIGGRALASMDNSITSLLNGLGKMGAVSSRLDVVYERLDRKDIPNLTKQRDDQLAVDMAETVMLWQQSIEAQQAAYQVSSQVMRNSLLNYLN